MDKETGTYKIKTQTPLYTVDWYVKWISCFFVLAAVACRSVEEVPKIYDMSFSLVGTIGWLFVSLVWQDRAMILLNGILSFVLAAGVLRFVLA